MIDLVLCDECVKEFDVNAADLRAKKITEDELFDNEAKVNIVNELTFRIFLSYCVQNKFYIHQIDIKTAYLNADVVGDVYVEQPPGYRVSGKEDYVYKLNKALYGLRQSALQWNIKLNELMQSIGLRRSLSDQCLYFGLINGMLCLIIVYVDDLLIIR